ncbi:MAG: isochorismatase family protein [Wenzhouxiangellaceae bacterium]|nr:isochorismatase family protein [Wenzhouxiangellaceae bacterium]
MQLPERNRIASFDVDAQRTFTPLCPDELPVEDGDTIGPELDRQAALARWRLGSKDSHSPRAVWVTEDREKIGQPGVPGENVEEHWPVHAVPGTEGFELVPGLPRPADYDFFVWKGVELDMHPYGACYHDIAERMSTGVIEWLQAREASHVLVGGLATDFCVKATALQLQAAGFQVLLNLGACRGIDPESTGDALAEMRTAGVRTFADSSALEPTQ